MTLSGFGNHHQTEAIKGALPLQQNSPLECPFGLYAEQLSGSAFTKLRHNNLRSWLYRKLPSVVHQDFVLSSLHQSSEILEQQPPNPYRWSEFEVPKKPIHFIESWQLIASTLQASTYLYQCNSSMKNTYFSDNDGELLIIPYQGEMSIFTEFGKLTVKPGVIMVIPRGVKFSVELMDINACGYLCENRGNPLTLPNLGLLGANALANPRHFIYPIAAFEENDSKQIHLVCKSQNAWWEAESCHSPLNVVAWQGNYAPYSYDLLLFNTINTVSFDHPDPSIFTVLTSESSINGVANLDFVIFPPRWLVANHSFRPPYFHRNIMNELMGLILGTYDAKETGFAAGGISIHNAMTAHGPDADTYYKTITKKQEKPVYLDNTLAFMLESCDPWQIAKAAFKHPKRQLDYADCWQGLKNVTVTQGRV